MPELSTVDRGLYHRTLRKATLANLTRAIMNWQKKNQDQQQVVGEKCDWDRSLGGDNRVLQKWLATTESIEASPIKELQ